MFGTVFSWFSQPKPLPAHAPQPKPERDERFHQAGKYEPVALAPEREPAPLRRRPAGIGVLPLASCAADRRLVGDLIEDRHRIELVNDRLRAERDELKARIRDALAEIAARDVAARVMSGPRGDAVSQALCAVEEKLTGG